MLMPTPAPLPAAAPVADSGDDQEEAERRHPMSESAHDSFVKFDLLFGSYSRS
jgi:hypothetical protein